MGLQTDDAEGHISPGIELVGLSKRFPNGVEAVRDITITVEQGEFLAVIGPSGSGKSTLLRLVAGLDDPTAGTIRLNGRDVTGLTPRERDVSMVFQEPALYPYLSVRNNLAFGLRARRASAAVIGPRVDEVSKLLSITELLDRRPATLSGGQKRRVALGRAVARRPAAFLLDEPLTGLDAPLRSAIREDLVALHKLTGAAVVYVTHDQEEALALGDRVALMNEGELVQAGRPQELYTRPATRFVGSFVGSPPMGFLRCTVSASAHEFDLIPAGSEPISMARDSLEGLLPILNRTEGRGVDLGIRPEHVTLAKDATSRDWFLSWLEGPHNVVRVEYQGHEALAVVGIGDTNLIARLPSGTSIHAGDRVSVGLDLHAASWFDVETGRSMNG